MRAAGRLRALALFAAATILPLALAACADDHPPASAAIDTDPADAGPTGPPDAGSADADAGMGDAGPAAASAGPATADSRPEAGEIAPDGADTDREAGGPSPADAEPEADAGGASADLAGSLCERACTVVDALACSQQLPCLPSCLATLEGKCARQGTALQGCIAGKRPEDFVCNAQQRPAARDGVCIPEQEEFATCLFAD